MKNVSISVRDYAGLRAINRGADNDAALAKLMAPAFAKRAVRVLALKGLVSVAETPFESVTKTTKNTVVTRKGVTKTYALTQNGRVALVEADAILGVK